MRTCGSIPVFSKGEKLADRCSLSARGIVATAQGFITKIAAGLGL